MNKTTVWAARSILACFGLWTIQACGGGDSSPMVSSGLPAGASVATLSESDAAQFCEATARAAAELLDESRLCTFLGAISAITVSESGAISIDRAACEASRDECVAQGTTTTMIGDCSSGEVAASLQGCDASVGQVEACLNAQLSLASEAFQLLDCTSAPTQQQAEEFQANQDPPECVSVEETCPDLDFDATGSAVSSEAPSATGCDDTCVFEGDGECDDGGDGAITDVCGLGTDCADCGMRPPGG